MVLKCNVRYKVKTIFDAPVIWDAPLILFNHAHQTCLKLLFENLSSIQMAAQRSRKNTFSGKEPFVKKYT